MPNIKIKPVEKALEALYNHCEQVAIQVMKMNNEIENLKHKIYQLENR
jgi:phage shock protein A